MDVSFSQNSYVEALTASEAGLGAGSSKEVIKVKWGHKGSDLIGLLRL